jgi:hypothetical protein
MNLKGKRNPLITLHLLDQAMDGEWWLKAFCPVTTQAKAQSFWTTGPKEKLSSRSFFAVSSTWGFSIIQKFLGQGHAMLQSFHPPGIFSQHQMFYPPSV